MPGEEAQLADAECGGPPARTGPRHAAPRKSLLTKLQMPAGKAIAIAAMPTAVLMGMGITPRLAQADELPKNPFSGRSCATASDTASASASPSAGGSDKSGSTATATPSPSASSSVSASKKTDKKDTSGKSGTSTPSPSASSATPSPSASASASASKSANALDPLGVGDALKSLLGVGDNSTASASASASPSASATSGATTSSSTTDKAAKTVKDTTTAVKKAAAEATKAAAEAAKAAKDTATSVTASPSASASSTASSAKTPYPCPTYDAKALAAATTEGGIPLLPDDPWTLNTSLLTLTGLNYAGIVEVKTYSGTIKKVLKFTASTVDIKDLQQTILGPGTAKTHVDARSGSTSTIRNGTVTMYTESLKGNLFGLIPVTFTPDSPPPVNVPVAFFTNATVIQAGQFGGTLTVPGMHLYNSGT
ncbi:hydrogenase expression protein HypF [Actinacidiphila oryziradicis]|uniref:Hydrogenase expression protein HypF n=1 Tax=Actinacidiphila oryziradicis TaxID=2571141 RepID=A0A4V5MZV6_9ACTN|nr:hydrogenase expression protein HypF [Actinacidiphila oryziradicis]